MKALSWLLAASLILDLEMYVVPFLLLLWSASLAVFFFVWVEYLIRFQRIYNFLLFRAIILSFLDVLYSFYSNFISFFGTNLLT